MWGTSFVLNIILWPYNYSMNIVGAGVIIEDVNGKILVTHRKPFVPEGGEWGIPGGSVVGNETPIETAKIKTKQEVRITVIDDKLTFLDKFNYDAEENNVTFYVWIYRLNTLEPEVMINTDGHDGYKWEQVNKLYQQKDLMVGLYPILEKYLQLKSQ